MKRTFIKIQAVALSLLLGLNWGCEDVTHSPYGDDSQAPGKVIVDQVKNTNGGAVIYFSSPADVDVLYVKAEFKDNNGKQREVKTSALLDSLVIKGYGATGDFPVSLYAVDRNENASEATNTTISPLEAPVNLVFPTLTGRVDYGGIKVTYANELQAELSINVTVLDSAQQKMVYRESFFTSQKSGNYSFRGYKSVDTKFGVYLEDRWGNVSDTAYYVVKPIPDEFLDKAKFSLFRIQNDKTLNEHGFSASQLWDGKWSDQWNGGHSDFSTPLPHYITIDLGQKAKLSRFKLYQRGGYELYRHGNPKHFKIYGTLDVNDLPAYDASAPNAGWTFLKECHSIKPSGLPLGQESAEDHEFQDKGEDFEFDPENLVEVRYVRLEILENWGGMDVTVIGELSFWGEITDTDF